MRKDIAGTPPLLIQILLTCSLFLTACDTDSTPNPTATSTSNITPTTLASPTLQLTPPGQTTSTTLPTSATTPSAQTTRDRAQPAAILTCAPDGEEAPRDSIGDPTYPKLGNSGYDTQHYTIDLEVDMERNMVSGTTTIRAVAARDLDGFNLDLERFDIRSVDVNDAPARHSHRDNELTVAPASQLNAGQVFTVAVSYVGEPNSDGSSGATFSEGWISYDRGVYVAGEPSGAPSWYPVNDHPCDKATYTLRVTVAEPYVVAANGTLKSETDNGPTRTYIFEARDPMASYLVTVNIAEYERVTEQGPDGLPIRNYFPRSLDAEARAPYDDTGEMIEYFSGLFGPYPFEVYGVVVVDDDIGFALETQTLSLFGRSVGGFRATAEEVVAHELAHQWFGNSVSLRTWRDIWLNEGFATYAEWLWRERDSVEGLKSYMYGVHNFAREGRLGPPGDPSPDDLFNPTVYVRGGLTLHALRLTVGDDAFFRTLRAYADEYRNSNADTTQFIAIAERESGKELDAFFQLWLYGEEVPDLPE